MPPRSSRSNNARNNKQHQHQHQQPTPPITDNDSPHRGVTNISHSPSPNLSPPAQLPTPLPDGHSSSSSSSYSSRRPFDDDAVAGAELLLPPFSSLSSVAHSAHSQDPADAQAERGRPSARLIDDIDFAFDATPQPPAIPITTTTDDFLTDLLSSDVDYHASLGNLNYSNQFNDQDRDEGGDREGDEEELARTYTYQSPPFRQAPLPEDMGSPPPLPVPPRTGPAAALQALRYGASGGGGGVGEEGGGGASDMFGFSGQIRSPMFARPANPFAPSNASANSPAYQSQPQSSSQPTQSSISSSSSSILDTLNRTIRGYIPPSSIPSPPSVSRPVTAVSFGRVSGSASGGGSGGGGVSGAVGSNAPYTARGGGSGSRNRSGSGNRDARIGLGLNRPVVSQQEYEREYERDEGEEEGVYGYGYGGGRHPAPLQPSRPPYSVDLGAEHEEGEEEDESEGKGKFLAGYRGGGSRPRYEAGQGQAYGYGYGARGGGYGHSAGAAAPTSLSGSGLAQAMRRGEPRYQDQDQSQAQTRRYDAQPAAPSSRITAGGDGGGARGAVRGHGRSASEAGVGVGTIGRGGLEATIRGGPGARAGLVMGTEARAGGGGSAGTGTRRTQVQGQGQVQADGITWARWDVLNNRRVLVLAYPAGLQVWDTSDLKSIKEVLNVRFDSDEWGLVLGGAGVGGLDAREGLVGTAGGGQPNVRVARAAVLPPPSRRARVGGGKDGFEDVRPLFGMLMDYAEDDGQGQSQERKSILVLYSLRTHHVVKLLPIAGRAETFEASGDAVVISTTAPPTLHILSAATFHTLHVIHSTSLEAFTSPPRVSPLPGAVGPNAGVGSGMGPVSPVSSSASPANNPSSGISLSIANAISNTLYSSSSRNSTSERGSVSPEGQSLTSTPISYPAPVFALSHRLLAYASPAPGTSPSSSPHPSSSPSLLGMGLNMASKASRRLSSSSSASGPSNAASSVSSSPFGGMGMGMGGGVQAGLGKITNITQADVGHAALKVGESMFSGMKFLGGMAFEAAKSRVGGVPSSGAGAGGPGGIGGGPGVGARQGGTGGRYVSRSAPDTADVDEAAGQMLRERRYSNISAVSGAGAISGSSATSSNHSPGSYLSAQPTTPAVAPHTKGAAEYGHYVTVLDLAPLFNSALKDQDVNSTINNASALLLPTKIDEFNASRSQPLAGLRFSQDGTSVGVTTRDGHSVKVFKLHPTPSIMLSRRGVVPAGASAEEAETEAAILAKVEMERRKATQVYDLYRGRTSAVVEDVDWAKDGRWVAVGTRNRTVHAFAVNPYGGKSDVRSHLEGRVKNVDVIEPPMTPLTAIAKLRGTRSAHVSAPLAFTFLSPCDIQSSPDLVPPRSLPPVSHSPSSPKVPQTKHKRSTNFQDILMFDPATGILSLRRLTLGKHSVKDQSLTGGVVSSVHALGVTSISLPGMGGAGKLSSSPSTKGNLSTAAAGTGAMKPADSLMELTAKESVMATWDLQRGRDWVEIKTAILPQVRATPMANLGGTRDWLAEGEITTGSNSQRVLPRSLYLSHQFLFHTLGEDYHALIRRYQFDIPGDKIDVRTQVEISAYSSPPGISSSGSGSSVGRGGALSRDDSAFVQDFSSSPHSHSHARSHSIQRVSSSFDEPIASAISGRFFEPDHVYSNSQSTTIPPILPMYPNGVGGASSFRNSISIPITRKMAGIGDGVSEGVARIRREMMYKSKAAGGSSGSGSSTRKEREREESGQPLVPLEFDEEDEDFAVGGGKDSLTPSGVFSGPGALHNPNADTSPNPVHPSGSFVPQPLQLTSDVDGGDIVGAVDEEIWNGGWDVQDRLAVEEQEGFYELDGRGVALGMGMGMSTGGGGGDARAGSGLRATHTPGADVEGGGQSELGVRAEESELEGVVRQLRDDSLTDVSSFASPKTSRKTRQKRRG